MNEHRTIELVISAVAAALLLTGCDDASCFNQGDVVASVVDGRHGQVLFSSAIDGSMWIRFSLAPRGESNPIGPDTSAGYQTIKMQCFEVKKP